MTKVPSKQLKGGAGGDSALLRDIISNVAVGAAPTGTKFPEGQNLTEFAEAILRKDIAPTITTSFSGSGIKEIGTQVNGTTMKLNISNLSSVTLPINKIDFYMGNTLLDSQPFVPNQQNYQFVYGSTISSNTTFKIILTYNSNRTTQGTGAFTFVYGSFYGATNVSTIDSNILNSLINNFTKAVKNTKELEWKNITLADERFCYAYPASLGTLSSIKDGNGFSQLDSYTRYQVDLKYPTNGDIVSYYVYLLTDSATGVGFTQVYA